MKKAIIIGAVIAAMLLAGCGHNINVQGVGIACPYGAMGYGTFSCVKDNVEVTSTEEISPEGKAIKHSNIFKVGKQVTGYDVEKEKVKQNKK